LVLPVKPRMTDLEHSLDNAGKAPQNTRGARVPPSELKVAFTKEPRKRLSPAYLFGANPGDLCVTTMLGEVRLQLREPNFLAR